MDGKISEGVKFESQEASRDERPLACVFGSSSDKIAPAYVTAVESLGERLGGGGWGLVFGGTPNGLMNAAANGFHKAGAPIYGVLPKTLASCRVPHPACTEYVWTENLSDRKERMIAMSHAFIAVPGGLGTFDEIFQVLAMKQIHEIECPIVFFNVDGFYDPLCDWLEKLWDEKLLGRSPEELWLRSDDPEEILEYLNGKI